MAAVYGICIEISSAIFDISMINDSLSEGIIGETTPRSRSCQRILPYRHVCRLGPGPALFTGEKIEASLFYFQVIFLAFDSSG
jgi:hypothetical protein